MGDREEERAKNVASPPFEESSATSSWIRGSPTGRMILARHSISEPSSFDTKEDRMSPLLGSPHRAPLRAGSGGTLPYLTTDSKECSKGGGSCDIYETAEGTKVQEVGGFSFVTTAQAYCTSLAIVCTSLQHMRTMLHNNNCVAAACMFL